MWQRVGGYSVVTLLWLVAVIPLAERRGHGAASYLAAFIASFAFAAVARGIYAWIRKRSFWSPWLFILAAAAAFVMYAGQVANEPESSGTVVRTSR